MPSCGVNPFSSLTHAYTAYDKVIMHHKKPEKLDLSIFIRVNRTGIEPDQFLHFISFCNACLFKIVTVTYV